MATLRLFNFRTNQFDTLAAPTSITDANAADYYPSNHVLDNHYATLRSEGETPIQALIALYATHHTLWN